jgi:hypothetical protein
MNSAISRVFTLIICSAAAPWLTFSYQIVRAQASHSALRSPQTEFLSKKPLSSDELFEKQKREQEILYDRWQQQQSQWQRQQQSQWQRQQQDRWQQQQQQQFLLQRLQQRQLQKFQIQQFRQPKLQG